MRTLTRVITTSVVVKKSNYVTTLNTGQMSSKFGEIIKKLISVFGEKPPEGYPSHPPPHRVKILWIYTWRECDIRTWTRNPPADLGRREKGRGEKITQILITQ